MFTTVATVCLVLVTLCAVMATLAHVRTKKVPLYRGQIQSSSGDSEVMMMNFDILPGDSEESKASKIAEAFQIIQDRRDENHEKWLAIKKQALEENAEKIASGEDLKLKSVTEG